MNKKDERIRLITGLTNTGLLAEFISRAQPNVKSSDLLAWLKSLPQLANVEWPYTLQDLRAKLGCPASHGGSNGGRGKQFYRVQSKPSQGRARDRERREWV